MKKYKCIIEYNGAKYHGMQRQTGQKTIQGALENAIKKLTNFDVEINYSGRTDAGVHAMGQVIDFSLENNGKFHCYNITNGLNFYLRNDDISVKKTDEVALDFDSRFAAKMRTYKYFVNLEKTKPVFKKDTHFHFPFDLNVENMLIASSFLLGKHNFSAFRSSECQSRNPVRTISEILIDCKGNELVFTISAKSFLHNMVRIIVGTLLDVGRGKISPMDTAKIIESGDRKLAGITAPAHGLYFFEVIY